MADFNFTVRATDDIGAYSDRSFSIHVENTLVNQFVATIEDGSIATSIDGQTWNNIPNVWSNTSRASSPYGDIINGNGVWLISVSPTTYLRSTDSLVWAEHSFPEGLSSTVDIANNTTEIQPFHYGNGVIAIILTETDPETNVVYPRMCTTEDGIEWTVTSRILWQPFVSSTANTNATKFQKLTYGNGYWFATMRADLGNNNVGVFAFKSQNNGQTWEGVVTPTVLGTVGTNEIHFFNGLWIAVTNTNQYLTSNDTVNWIALPDPSLAGNTLALTKMIYANGRIYGFPEMTGSSTNSTANSWISLYSGLDGVNWTSTNIGVIVNSSPSVARYSSYTVPNASNGLNRISFIFHNGVFILATRQSSTTQFLKVSHNGQTFGNTTGYSFPTGVVGVAAIKQIDV